MYRHNHHHQSLLFALDVTNKKIMFYIYLQINGVLSNENHKIYYSTYIIVYRYPYLYLFIHSRVQLSRFLSTGIHLYTRNVRQ